MHIMSTNFTKTLVGKHDYNARLWRHNTAHTKYKWPPYATKWTPPKKNFCVRHWLASSNVHASRITPAFRRFHTLGPRGIPRLDGVRGKKEVWRHHFRIWGLLGANVLFWRKYLQHYWDFSAPGALCAPSHPCYAPVHTPMIVFCKIIDYIPW